MFQRMKYVLEAKAEAQRLEKQSNSPLYNYNTELDGFLNQGVRTVLDAGCGSGLVARGVAQQFPHTMVDGVDASKERVAFAKKAAKDTKNAVFFKGDLTSPLAKRYERIFCRYVLEHIPAKQQLKAVKNLASALNSGGKLRLIDVDGLLVNLNPTTPFLAKCLKKFTGLQNIDLFVGRKLAGLMAEAGLKDVTWKIQTMQMNTPELLVQEITLIEERFKNTFAFMAKVLGSKATATKFQKEYLEALKKPGATLFYNKFIVTGTKERHLRVVK